MLKNLSLILFIFVVSTAWGQTYKLDAVLGTEYFKHDDGVKGVAFSPDGKYVVSSAAKDVIFWDRQNAKKIKTLSKMVYGIAALDYAPDGLSIALEDSC